MKLSKRLRELIEGFKTVNPSYGDHVEAGGCCGEASHAFHNLLVREGILRPPKKGTPTQKAEWILNSIWDIVLDDDHDRYLCPEWYPNITFEGHVVNYVEGHVIDWTARQYNSVAPFPLIYRPPKQAGLVVIEELATVPVKTGLARRG